MQINTFTSFPFKNRNFSTKKQRGFLSMTFFFYPVFIVKFSSWLPSLVSLLVCPGQPSKSLWAEGNIWHPARRSETKTPAAKEGVRAAQKASAPPQDVRAGTYCWLATGEPHQFALGLGLVWLACHWNFSMFWQIMHVPLKPCPIKIFQPSSNKGSLKLWRDF